MSGIQIKSLYKIFGEDPQAALAHVRDGMGKSQLLEEHNHVLGLQDININMPEDGIQVVMGLSGSGKSTLIRHINRLIEPTAGEVLVDGENVLNSSPQELKHFRTFRTAMVFQKFALLPHRTVMKNVEYGLEVQGIERKERDDRAQKWIDRVGLSGFEDRFPSQLSGGMQQRVGLARAL
ncbi:MAG: ATP-binding cassette domain-containing protein, partial [Pseudomonadota bacterium]